jgi:hypothetical protein
MWEYSNPNYTKVWEYFVNKSHRAVETRLHGNERYLGPLGDDHAEQFQGGYHCSIRSFTKWEQAGEPHGNGNMTNHPNYYSRCVCIHPHPLFGRLFLGRGGYRESCSNAPPTNLFFF